MLHYPGSTTWLFSTIYIDFKQANCQSLLIRCTHKISSYVWLWGLPFLPARSLFAVCFGIYICILLQSLYRNELNWGIEKSYRFHVILFYTYQYIQPQATYTLCAQFYYVATSFDPELGSSQGHDTGMWMYTETKNCNLSQ